MTYTALTIGPIYKTLKNAKKTREIWGASYFFSYVVKEIAKRLFEKEVIFITPYVEESMFETKDGVGLFHDRIIFKSESVGKKELDSIVDEVLQSIESESKDKLDFNFLKNYLQIHTVELNENQIKNPILDISPYLDTAELCFQTQKDEINKILGLVKKINGTFLAKDAFDNVKVKFPSLPKIALNSLDAEFDEEKDDEQELMQELIQKYPEHIKPYNKYICIVQADGDNMGKVLEEIGEDSKKLNEFSKTLFEFCKDATKAVKDFNGRMIYAGGDDLFFFAPVVSENRTIFELCDDLSNIFNKRTEQLSLKRSLPTISFGVSITYYKFPLYEARENAINLLFDKAKSGQKNAIAYRVTKHSGQTFEGIVYKCNNCLFENFLKLIAYQEDFDSNFLHSIYIKIDKFRDVINLIAKKENKRERLKNFFDNNFNEKEHDEQYREFFDTLIDFMALVYESYSENQLDFIYASLRIKKFLLGDKS